MDLERAWVRDAAIVAFESMPSELTGLLDITAKGKRVSVRGHVEGTAESVCDRCGEPCTLNVHSELMLAYLPERGDLDAELELGADDLDVGWYRDGEFQLGDVLREVLALALPSRTLCSDSAGCDARTEALLAGEQNSEDRESAFAALRQLT